MYVESESANPRAERWPLKYALFVVTMTIATRSFGAEPPPPIPPGCFAFGAFGDGPYSPGEFGRYQHVIEDANNADILWVVHVGDMMRTRCSDENYAQRLQSMNEFQHPVVFTPGDNDWTDCHKEGAGRYQPLERLTRLRKMFFDDPHTSLGARPMRLETQSDDPAFAEFFENTRWQRGGFVFATVHVVGSGNATDLFQGRTARNDDEVIRRTQAAAAWIDTTFAIAQEDSLHGVVLAMHGNIGLERPLPRFFELVELLRAHTIALGKPVLLIHGDSHVQRVDHPLLDTKTNTPLENFTRLEVFGSPNIGWVRVVVDTVAGEIIEYDPRIMAR